jgi:hypothetical protein
MTSRAQTDADRQNFQKSTGPSSPAKYPEELHALSTAPSSSNHSTPTGDQVSRGRVGWRWWQDGSSGGRKRIRLCRSWTSIYPLKTQPLNPKLASFRQIPLQERPRPQERDETHETRSKTPRATPRVAGGPPQPVIPYDRHSNRLPTLARFS